MSAGDTTMANETPTDAIQYAMAKAVGGRHFAKGEYNLLLHILSYAINRECASTEVGLADVVAKVHGELYKIMREAHVSVIHQWREIDPDLDMVGDVRECNLIDPLEATAADQSFPDLFPGFTVDDNGEVLAPGVTRIKFKKLKELRGSDQGLPSGAQSTPTATIPSDATPSGKRPKVKLTPYIKSE